MSTTLAYILLSERNLSPQRIVTDYTPYNHTPNILIGLAHISYPTILDSCKFHGETVSYYPTWNMFIFSCFAQKWYNCTVQKLPGPPSVAFLFVPFKCCFAAAFLSIL